MTLKEQLMADFKEAMKAKDFAKAAENFKKVLELDPENGNAAIQLGQAYMKGGKFDDALQALEVAKANGQEGNAVKMISQIYLMKAQSALKAKKYQEVIDMAAKSNEVLENANAYKLSASAAQRLGKNDECIAFYESDAAKQMFGDKLSEMLAAEKARKANGEKYCDCPACTLALAIYAKKDYLSKKSVWIFGGDGWAYDIGYGGVDHVLASGKNVNIFVFDTEVYSNTGGQASKASNIGQVAQFAAAGKEIKKKSLSEIAMSYGYVYVAQVAMGANPAQTIKAITEAEAYNGPSLIIGYSPCEMHSIKGGMMNCQKEMKRAVDCGYWNLFRFNPDAEQKFTLDSKAPAGGYQEFLMNEARYSRLTREFPDRADALFERNEAVAKERYEHLLKLVELYKD